MNVLDSSARCHRPPRALPPPDPRALIWQPRHWSARPDLSAALPTWARVVLPRRIPVLVPGRRSTRPLARAGAMTTVLCIVWGCMIGVSAGAVAGTLIVPLFGTAYGGAVGALTGAIVGTAWAPFTVTVLAVRHRHVATPHAILADVARVLGIPVVLLGLLAIVVVVAFLMSDSPVLALWAAAVVTATIAVVIRLLRTAVLAISEAWCAPFGWHRV